jgi:formylglycine-generating enzyme required for sulfatase activity
LADIAVLKNDAFQAAEDEKYDLAEQIWIRVLVAASGRDMQAVRALQRLERLRSGQVQARPQPATPTQRPADSARSASPEVVTPAPPTPVRESVPVVPESVAPRIVLSTFKFETVKLNERGKIVERKSLEARQFAEDLGDGITIEMVAISGGEFLMGAPKGEESSGDDERPQHRVSVPDFFMGRYPVTQAQWKRVAALPQEKLDLAPEPSNFKGAQRPVERVSWLEATEFCERLSRATGKQYRLPSEAEWEYACRAGTTTPFHFGPTISPEVANYNGNYTYGKGPKGKYPEQTTNVGIFPANTFGLYDIHGNVWEWCQDEWHDTYKNSPSDGSAWEENKNTSNQSPRLLRGGSWFSDPAGCRSADRFRRAPDYRGGSIGFRLISCFPMPRT